MWPFTLAQGDIKPEFFTLYSSEASSRGDPVVNLAVGGHSLIFSPGILAFQGRNFQKKEELLDEEEKQKEKILFAGTTFIRVPPQCIGNQFTCW